MIPSGSEWLEWFGGSERFGVVRSGWSGSEWSGLWLAWTGSEWSGIPEKAFGYDTLESHWKNKIGKERFGVVRSGRSGSEWSGLWEKALD